MCPKKLPRHAFLLFATYAVSATSALTAEFQIIDTGYDGLPHTLSSDGQVVSGVGFKEGEGWNAWSWSRDSDTAVFPALDSDELLYPSASSVDGAVIAGISRGNAGAQEAFLWSGTTGTISLDPEDEFERSFAQAISADGTVVVGGAGVRDSEKAFRWTVANGIEFLDRFPDNVRSSNAFGISRDGEVIVGISRYDDGGRTGFLWTEPDGHVPIEFPGKVFSNALDVSTDSSTVIGFGWNGTDPDTRRLIDGEAYRMTDPTGVVGLGVLPGHEVSRPTAVSADGEVVLGWSLPEVEPFGTAFVWDELNGMRSLREVLKVDHGLDMPAIQTPVGISDDKTTILAYSIPEDGPTPVYLIDLDKPLIPSGEVCDPNTLGDLDGDGMVSFADFLILSTNFGATGTSHESGDVDCNGTVEFADFLLLSANFGHSVDGAESVPEPSGPQLAMAALMIAALVSRQRR